MMKLSSLLHALHIPTGRGNDLTSPEAPGATWNTPRAAQEQAQTQTNGRSSQARGQRTSLQTTLTNLFRNRPPAEAEMPAKPPRRKLKKKRPTQSMNSVAGRGGDPRSPESSGAMRKAQPQNTPRNPQPKQGFASAAGQSHAPSLQWTRDAGPLPGPLNYDQYMARLHGGRHAAHDPITPGNHKVAAQDTQWGFDRDGSGTRNPATKIVSETAHNPEQVRNFPAHIVKDASFADTSASASVPRRHRKVDRHQQALKDLAVWVRQGDDADVGARLKIHEAISTRFNPSLPGQAGLPHASADHVSLIDTKVLDSLANWTKEGGAAKQAARTEIHGSILNWQRRLAAPQAAAPVSRSKPKSRPLPSPPAAANSVSAIENADAKLRASLTLWLQQAADTELRARSNAVSMIFHWLDGTLDSRASSGLPGGSSLQVPVLDLSGRGLSSIPPIPEGAKEIRFSANNLSSLSGLHRLPKSVTSLVLDNNLLQSVAPDIRELNRPYLKISLGTVRLAQEDIATLEEAKSLSQVQIEYRNESDASTPSKSERLPARTERREHEPATRPVPKPGSTASPLPTMPAPLPKAQAGMSPDTSARFSSSARLHARINSSPDARRTSGLSSPGVSPATLLLDEWARSGPGSETAAREAAADRIIAHANAGLRKRPLDLSGLQLSDFPPGIPEWTRSINFQGNRLREMPPVASLPPNAELNLLDNAITGLPADWDTIESAVTITFNPESLPMATRIALEARFDQDDYEGPKFKYPAGIRRNQAATQLADSVKTWTDAGLPPIRDWTEFRLEDNSNSFATFLDRLREVDLYKSAHAEAAEDARRKGGGTGAAADIFPQQSLHAFRLRVVNLLKQLEEEPELRAACFGLAHDALGNCANRIALRLMDMETLCLNKRFERDIENGLYNGRPQAVIDFCKAQYRNQLIAEAALRKNEGVKEEALHVETLLIFFNRFAEKYRLPVTMTSSPGNLVHVTEQEFDELDKKLGNGLLASKADRDANNQSFLRFLATSSAMNLLLTKTVTGNEMKRLQARIDKEVKTQQDRLQEEVSELMGDELSPGSNEVAAQLKEIQTEYLRIEKQVQEKLRSQLISNFVRNRTLQATLDS